MKRLSIVFVVLALSGFIAACAGPRPLSTQTTSPTDTRVPTASPTATATVTPAPTLVPTPTKSLFQSRWEMGCPGLPDYLNRQGFEFGPSDDPDVYTDISKDSTVVLKITCKSGYVTISLGESFDFKQSAEAFRLRQDFINTMLPGESRSEILTWAHYSMMGGKTRLGDFGVLTYVSNYRAGFVTTPTSPKRYVTIVVVDLTQPDAPQDLYQ